MLNTFTANFVYYFKIYCNEKQQTLLLKVVLQQWNSETTQCYTVWNNSEM